MHCVLKIVSGPLEGRLIDLSGDELSIGRDPACDIRLEGEDVSRRHARLLRDENYYWLEDLGSKTGTLVNGRRTQRRCLAAGDVVQIGSHRLRFESEGTGTERQADEEIARTREAVSAELAGDENAPVPRLPLNVAAAAATAMALVGLPSLFGLWSVWPFGLGGLVLGVFGLVQVAVWHRDRGLALALAGMLLGIVSGGWGVWNAVVEPRLHAGRLEAVDSRCRENLTRLAGALRDYALVHSDGLPESLDALEPAVPGAAAFVCPACTVSGGREAACRYLFPGAGKVATGRRDQVLLCCPRPHRDGGFTLRGDGRVERLTLDDMKALLGSLTTGSP